MLRLWWAGAIAPRVHTPVSPKYATPIRSGPLAVTLALPTLLGAALALRLYSIHFGLPALNDPDELTFELGAVRMLSGPTLNPGWFGHPATTTMYVLAVLTVAVFGSGHMLGWFPTVRDFANAIYTDPSWVILPGRVAMAAFAVGTIYLTYRLARDLFDRRTALIAAALLTINPVHITWSQIIRSDMMACFFMLLCMLAALRLLRENRWRDLVLASLWLGLAMATKWPFAITALSVASVVILRAWVEPAERTEVPLRLMLFGVMALGFLLLASPYLLIDHTTALRNMHGEAQLHHLGATGGTAWENAWWYFKGPILTGIGPIGALLAAIGSVVIAKRREALTILGPVAIGFFAVICSQHIIWERWVLPLMPLLAITAAAGLMWLAGLLTPGTAPRYSNAAVTLVLAVTLLPLWLRTEADARARLDDTRQRASQWAFAHVPAGSTVLVEHFGFDLLPQPWKLIFPFGDIGCVDVRAYLGGKVQLATVEAGRGARSNVDYGTVAPETRRSCRADYAILSQADRYAAERSAFPAEDAAYRELLARGTLVATFSPEKGKVGGPVVRVVRFSR